MTWTSSISKASWRVQRYERGTHSRTAIAGGPAQTALSHQPGVSHVTGARGEPEGGAPVSSEGEQRGAPAGDPERPGPLQRSLQHCSRARQHPHSASLPGEQPCLSRLPLQDRVIKVHVSLFLLCQSLLETHDSVAAQVGDSPASSPGDFVDHDTEDEYKHTYPPPDAIRMVGIRKVAGEHLVGETYVRSGVVWLSVVGVQSNNRRAFCVSGCDI